MDLVILGSSGTYSARDGACSGYLVQHDGYTIWVDAGNGTLGKLQRHVGIHDVDAIFLSHSHPDHMVDLLPYFYALLTQDAGPKPVYAPEGVWERLEGLIGSDGGREKLREMFDWHVMKVGETTELGPVRLETFDAVHPAVNLTTRFSAAGRTMCYSGDTGPNDDLVDAARGADLFLCEASWLEGQGRALGAIHLTAAQAGSAAAAAGVGRLLLTHIWPHNDLAVVREQAAHGFEGTIEMAPEHERVTV